MKFYYAVLIALFVFFVRTLAAETDRLERNQSNRYFIDVHHCRFEVVSLNQTGQMHSIDVSSDIESEIRFFERCARDKTGALKADFYETIDRSGAVLCSAQTPDPEKIITSAKRHRTGFR